MNRIFSIIKNIKNNWKNLDEGNIPTISKKRQILEIIVLLIFKGIGPQYYFQGRFWRPSISFKDKMSHCNASEYRNFVLRWNDRVYQKTSQHKVLEKAVLQLFKIETAEFIGFLHQRIGYSSNGSFLRNKEDLVRVASNYINQIICIKTVEGFGGSGFSAFLVKKEEAGYVFIHPISRSVVSISDWFDQSVVNTNGYIIEKYINQHELLKRLHPSSVNTARMWLIQLPHETKVIGAYLRIGQKSNMVDNVGCGGLFCPIDIEIGRVKYAIDDTKPWETIHNHPDTNSKIFDIYLPHWQASMDLACKALESFPHMRFAGVDVAYSENGPVMIELNVWPDQIGCAWMDLPLGHIDEELRLAYAND